MLLSVILVQVVESVPGLMIWIAWPTRFAVSWSAASGIIVLLWFISYVNHRILELIELLLYYFGQLTLLRFLPQLLHLLTQAHQLRME